MSVVTDAAPGRRRAQKDATRAAIIRAAQKLFLDKGYDATTTRDIARSCGLATGTVFSHFAEKSLILREILSSNIEQWLGSARSTITDRTGGGDALLIYARTFLPQYLAMPELSRTLLRSVMFDRKAYRRQLEAFVAEIANRLQHDAPSLAAEGRMIASETLIATYLGIVVEALGDEPTDAEAAVARLEARCRLLLAPYRNAR